MIPKFNFTMKNEISLSSEMAAEMQQMFSTCTILRIETALQQLSQALTQITSQQLSQPLMQTTPDRIMFIWKIPKLQRVREFKKLSLYSTPFYTSHPGYKMCLRLYLNGDGSGKGTHVSIFFVLMKGEYDAQLPWPFRQKVTLMLLAQDGLKKNIVQSFKPDPSSSSFQRPISDMNEASGCPQFAPLSALEDPSYVKEDVLFIQCIVGTSKIFHP